MSYAEDVIDGIFCEGCGTYLGEATGFPQRCPACGGTAKPPGDREDVAAKRMYSTKKELTRLGYHVKPGPDDKSYSVCKDSKKLADFWPYNGWFNPVGAMAKNRRGFKNLVKFLKERCVHDTEEKRSMPQADKGGQMLQPGVPGNTDGHHGAEG